MSQSALTRSIQALEDDLGLLLFERNRSGVSPTPEGRRILEQGRDLLRITADQLIRFPLLMPHLREDHWTLIGTLYGSNFDRASARHLMCNDFHSLKAAAMDSDGILMCVQDTLETELSDGTLQRLEMTQHHSDIGWNIGMVSLEGRRLSRAGQMLFEKIRQILHVDASTT